MLNKTPPISPSLVRALSVFFFIPALAGFFRALDHYLSSFFTNSFIWVKPVILIASARLASDALAGGLSPAINMAVNYISCHGHIIEKKKPTNLTVYRHLTTTLCVIMTVFTFGCSADGSQEGWKGLVKEMRWMERVLYRCRTGEAAPG